MADNMNALAPYGVGENWKAGLKTDQNWLGSVGNALSALENPNVQRAMMQLGEEMDPQGAGGVMGRTGQGMLNRQLISEALAKGGSVKVGADGSTQVDTTKSPNVQPGQEQEQQGQGLEESALKTSPGLSLRDLEGNLFSSLYDEEE